MYAKLSGQRILEEAATHRMKMQLYAQRAKVIGPEMTSGSLLRSASAASGKPQLAT